MCHPRLFPLLPSCPWLALIVASHAPHMTSSAKGHGVWYRDAGQRPRMLLQAQFLDQCVVKVWLMAVT